MVVIDSGGWTNREFMYERARKRLIIYLNGLSKNNKRIYKQMHSSTYRSGFSRIFHSLTIIIMPVLPLKS